MQLSRRLRALDDRVYGPDARWSMGWGEMLRARAASQGRPGGGPSEAQARVVRAVIEVLVYGVLLFGLATAEDASRSYWVVALVLGVAFDALAWVRHKRKDDRLTRAPSSRLRPPA